MVYVYSWMHHQVLTNVDTEFYNVENMVTYHDVKYFFDSKTNSTTESITKYIATPTTPQSIPKYIDRKLFGDLFDSTPTTTQSIPKYIDRKLFGHLFDSTPTTTQSITKYLIENYFVIYLIQNNRIY